jgi:pre-60S factor REI1
LELNEYEKAYRYTEKELQSRASKDVAQNQPISSSVDPSPFDPSMCFFCTQKSSSTDENLNHMRMVHGFLIPDQEHVIHMESFMGYLHALIMDFKECLYCDTTRSTSKGVQQHMLTKGHCKISSIDDQSEYRDFYEYTTGYHVITPQLQARETEGRESRGNDPRYMHLPSGRVIGDRNTAQAHDKQRTSQQESRTTHPDRQEIRNADLSMLNQEVSPEAQPETKKSLSMSARNQKGLIGVSEWQKRTLRATEKKVLRDEIQARNRYQARIERGANRQEHFHVRLKC